ncbi:MAG: hypothetical protein OQJ81_00140 [Melioribacteraceae bacterium]|nr:hypothetical protein [Melioribacteraceae bacterium]
MRNIQNPYDYEIIESNTQIINRFKLFVLKPVFIGLFAFSIFFTTILITKILMYTFNEHAVFNLNVYDILFALIGFGLGFLIEFILSIRKIFFK